MAALSGVGDKERFEKELSDVFHKAISATEAAPKEKHVRNAVIATWKEKGCSSYWRVLKQFPLLRSQVVCWKACFVVHRTFRDGHKNVVKNTVKEMRFLSELGKHWSHSVAAYPQLITAYIRVLMNRVSFVVKNPEVPANFSFDDEPFKIPGDIDEVFQLAVEVFDVQSSLLHLYAAILSKLDPSSGTGANVVRCRLAPLVPAIQDSAALYDIIFKLMKALHAALPADTLSGHRDRFNRQYQALRKYFIEAGKMEYVQSLVSVPTLDETPPSFLLPGQLIELELAKQVHTIEQVEEEPSITTTQVEEASVFDSQFQTFGEGFDFSASKRDERDSLIEQLMREIVELKEKIEELEGQRSADQELLAGMRERYAQLEAELRDYKDIAEQTCNENVLLKRQIDASRTEQGAQSEAEDRARAAEDKFGKLREVYQKLRTEHITLLRKSGETQKQLQTVTASVGEKDEQSKELERKISSLTMEVEELKVHASDESAQVTVLREELRRKEAHSIQLEQAQKSLSEELEAKAKTPPHELLVCALEEAESLIKRVLSELDSPAVAGATCTPALLLERTKACLDTIDSTASAFSLYNKDPTSLGGALSSLPSLSHSVGEVLLQGVATSHQASAEDGQKLVDASKSVGQTMLEFLEVLKKEKVGSGTIASQANNVQKSIRGLERLAAELVAERVSDEATADQLGDVVEEEMSATASAVEAAALRIQEMLRKSREDDSGVKLEVNERILDACTDLMKAIKVLIARSRDLQGEIIKEGMGTLKDATEFYQKNSRWSEGLISAAKQVGWGATVLVDSADKVVSRTGKFEELVVASHNIAASTAQLVAASRVKARPKSDNLKSLKASSRAVSEATGQVVASTQSGLVLHKQDSEVKMDYTKLSLTQAKRLEMESQVKALELEKELESERTRLAELRKVHYKLAGASEGWDEEQTEN